MIITLECNRILISNKDQVCSFFQLDLHILFIKMVPQGETEEGYKQKSHKIQDMLIDSLLKECSKLAVALPIYLIISP